MNVLNKDFQVSRKTLNVIKTALTVILRIMFLLAVGYIIIYPLLHMIVTSVKDEAAFYDSAKIWIPSAFNIKFNYSMAIDAIKYGQSLWSTFFNELIAAILEILSCSVVAYGFSRFKVKYKRFWVACLFLTILIPETMYVIPRMVNYSNLDILGVFGLLNKITGVDLRPNLIGTPLAFWLPSFFALGLKSGLLIYIYIQFFNGLPYELEEAAWVDGAGPIRTFISIALPSSSVVFTTVTVFAFIWHWNDSYFAALYTFNKFPLAVNLSRIIDALNSMGFYGSANVEAQAIIMASCVLFVIPPLILYIILQRKFIESIDRVGITG